MTNASRALPACAALIFCSALGAGPSRAAPASALEEARAAYAAGKAEDVLFALLPAGAVPAADAPEAARLLTDAGRLAAAKSDYSLAQQLWQAAVKKDPAAPLPVELLARRELEEKEFDLALTHARRWSELRPGDAEAASVLARAEVLRSSWHPGLDTPKPKPAKERVQVNAAPIPVVPAKAQSRAGSGRAPITVLDRGPIPQGKIILYGTGWCGVCAKARKWLQERGLAFDDRDIDHDRASGREVREKLLKVGKAMKGVPVIEVNGRLMQGFSAGALEEILRGPQAAAPPPKDEAGPESSLWDALTE
jgi:glutaredoxin